MAMTSDSLRFPPLGNSHRPLGADLFSVVLLLICLCLAGCGSDGDSQSSGSGKKQAKPLPVALAEVRKADIPRELTTVGSVEPFAAVAIKSQVAGILEHVHFKEGESVKQGEILFTIDQRPFAAKVAQLKAALAKDQAALANARKQSLRYQSAAASGYVSSEQADQAQTSVATLDATILADEAALLSAQLDLDNCIIRAPISGNSGALQVDEGNLVKASADIPLVTLNQMTPVRVSFTLPEQQLAAIRQAQSSGELEILVSNPVQPQEELAGKMSFLDNSVDQTTGTIRMKADFANSRQELWPGQFIPVKVRLALRKDVLVVPLQAVQTGQAGDYVFVVGAEQRVQVRAVSVDFQNADMAVIASGLQAGETVVTDGQLRLREGAVVKAVASSTGETRQ